MYILTEPFVMPEKVMLRTHHGNAAVAVGSCHMAVPRPEEITRTVIGSCHMAVPQLDSNDSKKKRYGSGTMHKEVVVLG